MKSAHTITKPLNKTTNCNILKDKVFDVYCGRGKGIKNDPLNCIVGENGWLGNPVVKGVVCPICSKVHKNGGETLTCYRKYLNQRLTEKEFKEEFLKLEGKKLGCFCKPSPCHTDVIIEELNRLIVTGI